mgnify:FL=1
MTQQAITEDVTPNSATPAAAPAADVQSSDTRTNDQLGTLIEEAVDRRLTPAFQLLQSQITPLHMLQPQLEELLGSTRNTLQMVERIFAGNATEEDKRYIDEATKLQQAQTRAEKAEAAARAMTAAQITPVQDATRRFTEENVPRAERLSVRNGIPWDEIRDAAMALEVKASAKDPYALQAWDQAVEKYITDEADKRHAAAQAKVIVPAARGGGAPEPIDNISLIKRGLEGRKE